MLAPNVYSLQVWFFKHTKLPIILTAIGMVLVQGLYFAYSAYELHSRQLSATTRLVEIASLGANQKNRPIIESTMAIAINDLNAKAALVCEDSKTIIAQPDSQMNCAELRAAGLFDRLVSMPALGSPRIVFHFVLPIFPDKNLFLFMIALSSLFLLGSLFALMHAQKRIESDLLKPLTENLDNENPIAIHELEYLRLRNKSHVELLARRASEMAVFKHNAQMAHDIQAPLALLRSGHLALKNNDLVGADEMVGLATKRIEQVTRNLLNNNRKFAGGAKHRTNTDVKRLLEDVARELRLALKEYGKASAEITVDSEVVSVAMDDTILARIILNLAINAIEAVQDGGRIELCASKLPSGIAIEIRDNGPGLPEAIRLDPKRGLSIGKSAGNGMGLRFAFEQIERAGGSLDIKTGPTGTCFCICLSPADDHEVVLAASMIESIH